MNTGAAPAVKRQTVAGMLAPGDASALFPAPASGLDATGADPRTLPLNRRLGV
jgi:hypothetical protein